MRADDVNGSSTEPRQLVPRKPRSAVTVILGINIVVFAAWLVSLGSEPLQRFLVDNFLVSTQHLLSGRVWTLLTAAFSHAEVLHFAINMIVLMSFGRPLERLLGTRVFVGFYLTAAVISSLSHCFLSLLIGRGFVPALGASGALSGLLLVFALIFPRERILLFGVIPIPALVGALAFVGLDVWGLIAQSQGGGLRIGHGAHLGGSVCGALFYFTVLRDRVRAARSRLTLPVTPEEAAELERLRAKVHREGRAALNPKEQDFLARIRERVESGQHSGGSTP
jgi:membrane associated rhomboid family serine protease